MADVVLWNGNLPSYALAENVWIDGEGTTAPTPALQPRSDFVLGFGP